jgi:large subunit ribosomal protein L24
MAGKMPFVKGDMVRIIAGKDRERTGKGIEKRGRITSVIPETGRLTVAQMNICKRHTRPNQQKGQQGGIVDKEAPIHHSNVQLICPQCHKPTRVKNKRGEQGERVRICKLCGAGVGEARE